MKIRLDYVTNSSSSSYICEICNRAESVYDGSINDIGMLECSYGHIMCKTEVEDYIFFELKLTTEQIKSILKTHIRESGGDVWYDEEDVDRWITDGDGPVNFEYVDSIPECLCPICNCKEVSDYDYLRFLSKITGFTKQDFKKYLTENFSSYDDFKEFLR